MKTNIKRVAAALCSCTLLAAGLTACGSTEAESVMDPTVAVQVQNVRRGSIELQGTYVGSVSAAESVNVIPLVQGATVESVNVAVGSEVKQGQVLAKLDSTSADLTAKNAQAAYNSALAQAQSALGGQWKTNIYSAERGIDQLDDNIDNMNDQIDKLKDKKGSANNTHIGVEMCEPDCIKYKPNSAEFTCSDLARAREMATRTYNSAVELFAMLSRQYQ